LVIKLALPQFVEEDYKPSSSSPALILKSKAARRKAFRGKARDRLGMTGRLPMYAPEISEKTYVVKMKHYNESHCKVELHVNPKATSKVSHELRELGLTYASIALSKSKSSKFKKYITDIKVSLGDRIIADEAYRLANLVTGAFSDNPFYPMARSSLNELRGNWERMHKVLEQYHKTGQEKLVYASGRPVTQEEVEEWLHSNEEQSDTLEQSEGSEGAAVLMDSPPDEEVRNGRVGLFFPAGTTDDDIADLISEVSALYSSISGDSLKVVRVEDYK